jgi:hypothetical protein
MNLKLIIKYDYIGNRWIGDELEKINENLLNRNMLKEDDALSRMSELLKENKITLGENYRTVMATLKE